MIGLLAAPAALAAASVAVAVFCMARALVRQWRRARAVIQQTEAEGAARRAGEDH